jgi:dienelactone hydrolase
MGSLDKLSTSSTDTKLPRKSILRRWVRRGFFLWATLSTLWLANSFRTRGVDTGTLRSTPKISIVNDSTTLQFLPRPPSGTNALVFICGGGVSAHAYAPLLRPLADAGYPVFIVKLPYRFAPLEAHKQAAIDRVRNTMSANQRVSRWVISGHSLGGALACRAALSDPSAFSAMVLIGTTHPKQDDLSTLPIQVTKVYASNDGVAPPNRTLANKGLLPETTKWVEIKGGNHSQFGHYGHQLFDGKGTITRKAQQTATRSAIMEALVELE